MKKVVAEETDVYILLDDEKYLQKGIRSTTDPSMKSLKRAIYNTIIDCDEWGADSLDLSWIKKTMDDDSEQGPYEMDAVECMQTLACYLEKDMGINYMSGNPECCPDEVEYDRCKEVNIQRFIGFHKTKNGLSFLGMMDFDDDALPVYFIFYFDGTRLRCYLPTYGNCYNTIDMEEIDPVSNMNLLLFLQKCGCDWIEDEEQAEDFIHGSYEEGCIGVSVDMMLRDIDTAIEIKKEEEDFGSLSDLFSI